MKGKAVELGKMQTDILQGLDDIPWAELEHAYGSAEDVPALLRQLLDPDPKMRSETMRSLYGNVFHQGTRYPAAPYVIPFLIKMCANPAVPERSELLRFWAHLITGYFNIRERPVWGDGEKIYWFGEEQQGEANDPYSLALHQIYRESLKGYELLCELLNDEGIGVRASAALVIACLPTKAPESLPKLKSQLKRESSGWVRAAIAFTLGELGDAPALHRLFAEDNFPAVLCMASCQLARIQPTEALIEPLMQFVSEPIDGYEDIPGAGGKSTDDAAFSISYLPVHLQQKAIPGICDRLEQAGSFDTVPLVYTLLTASFSASDKEVTELTDLQRYVLGRMVQTAELWCIADLRWTFKSFGLPPDRKKCAQMVGIDVIEDEALKLLRSGLMLAKINFLEKGRAGILEALTHDSNVFERIPDKDESWLLYAKAFAESDPDRALNAYQHALTINPSIARKVDPTWHLADLLQQKLA